jgi:predicted nucleic acid-binding protein
MKLFLDTSAIIKAFHNEQGSEIMLKLLLEENVSVWISELTKIEYKSAIFRRFNNKQISEISLQIAFEGFNEYLQKISIVPINSITILEAENIFTKYNSYGLRTLDAIQFASFNLLSDKEIKFVTADEKLYKIVETDGFSVINPINYAIEN